MALVDDLFKELKNKNIFFEIDKDPEDNRIFIVKTQSTLLAIGVEVADEINSSKLPFGNLKNDYLKRLHDFYFQLAEPLNGISKDPKKDGKLSFIFFFISENHIVLDPDFWGEWTRYDPEDNLNKFFIELSQHPELRTKEQKMEDEIDELKSNLYSLEQEVLKYKDTNEKLEQSLSYSQKGRNIMEKENKEIKEQMYSENIIKENLQKEVHYLSKIVKKRTISRLSAKQIEYLKNRRGFPLIIDIELFHPNLILEYATEKSRMWGTAADWVNLPATDFLIIDQLGLATPIDLEKIIEQPNFIGFSGDYEIRHIIGSISITMEDFDITT